MSSFTVQCEGSAVGATLALEVIFGFLFFIFTVTNIPIIATAAVTTTTPLPQDHPLRLYLPKANKPRHPQRRKETPRFSHPFCCHFQYLRLPAQQNEFIGKREIHGLQFLPFVTVRYRTPKYFFTRQVSQTTIDQTIKLYWYRQAKKGNLKAAVIRFIFVKNHERFSRKVIARDGTPCQWRRNGTVGKVQACLPRRPECRKDEYHHTVHV